MIDIAAIRRRKNATAALAAALEACAATLADERTSAVWQMPSRCRGWQVRHVYAHVLGQLEDAAAGAPGIRTPDEQAFAIPAVGYDELKARFEAAIQVGRDLLANLTDDLWSAPAGTTSLTIGEGVIALAHDARLHDDDVRSLYHEPCTSGDVWLASLDHISRQVTRRGTGFVVELTDTGRLEVGSPTPTIDACTTYDFVLGATGRRHDAPAALASLNIYP